MANHAWDEPLIKIGDLNKKYNILLATPIIGEIVDINNNNQSFAQWWTEINKFGLTIYNCEQ